MTFFGHGLIGAAAEASIARACGASEAVEIACAVHGFVGGVIPDVTDWIAWKFFGCERWNLYGRMHNGYEFWWLMVLFPAFPMHTVLVDPFFHDPTKPRKWWSRLWWAEILGWVVPIAVMISLWSCR